MPENILVATAWPYANGSLHVGHIAGCFLPADIFARYQRMIGNTVLMISGSDQHGTPITLRAEQEGVTPNEIAKTFHNEFLECWKTLGITFDLYTTTGTKNHESIVHDIFNKLKKKNLIFTEVGNHPYCEACKKFLPDRYVEGQCPSCSNTRARGDQCDNCGKLLSPEELVNAQCKICTSPFEFRESTHFFLKLSHFSSELLKWVDKQKHWRTNVKNFTFQYIKDGLKDRAISRDINWGIKIPVSGFENKRIYVWFEAVIGYLSAAIEWSKNSNKPEQWKDFWQNPKAKIYNFIGKDNIPFHTIIWPAILLGYENMNLPYNVVANEYMNLEKSKLSTSNNWAVWIPDYLKRYETDPLRYYLTATMPETKDSDFSWKDFFARNNNELVGTLGNFIHRILSFTHRQYNGIVPTPGKLNSEDNNIIKSCEKTLNKVGNAINNCHFREALRLIFELAQTGNQYLDKKEPWKQIKIDLENASTTLWTGFQIISTLNTLITPFLPFSAEKLTEILGINKHTSWIIQTIPGGTKFLKPFPLFKKFDAELIATELDRLKKN